MMKVFLQGTDVQVRIETRRLSILVTGTCRGALCTALGDRETP